MIKIFCDGCECEQNHETGTFKNIKRDGVIKHFCSECFKEVAHTIDVFKTQTGTRIKYIKRCELCKYAKIDLLSDNLYCIVNVLPVVEVDDYHLCDSFILDEEVKRDIIQKTMSAF